MTVSYFKAQGNAFVPGEHAAGPWSADMMHGRFFGGLAARALEREFCDDQWRVSRLTVDLFRPAPLELVNISTTLVRHGRRIRVADAVVTVAGILVASARAIILAEGTPPPGRIWTAPVWDSPPPEELPGMEKADSEKQSSAWQFRIHEGGFQSEDRSRVWTKEDGALIEGEAVSPLVRAALSGDLASPLSNGGSAGVGYINADYTLAMARYPIGRWVGLETTTHLASSGIAVGASTLYDLSGPFGTSTTTALANPILG